MFIFCFQICLQLMNHGQTEKRRIEGFWGFFMGYGRAGDTPLLLSYWNFFCLCWVFMISQKHYVMGISGRGYMACSHLIHLHTPIFSAVLEFERDGREICRFVGKSISSHGFTVYAFCCVPSSFKLQR